MPVAVAAIIAGCTTACFFIWTIGQLIKNRTEASRGKQSALTTSELEAVVQRAAVEAMLPLQRRIENLESAFVDDSSVDLKSVESGENKLLSDVDTFETNDVTSDGVRVTQRG